MDKPGFTYYDKTYKCYSRLDYVLLSEHLSGDISDIYITEPPRSNGVIDHKAVIVSFRIQNTVRLYEKYLCKQLLWEMLK